MDDYSKDFLSGDDAAKKLAVKRLTLKIGTDMKQMTVNAPDWSVSGLGKRSRVNRQGYLVRGADGSRAAVGTRARS